MTVTTNLGFKATILFNVKQLENGKRYSYIFNLLPFQLAYCKFHSIETR